MSRFAKSSSASTNELTCAKLFITRSLFRYPRLEPPRLAPNSFAPLARVAMRRPPPSSAPQVSSECTEKLAVFLQPLELTIKPPEQWEELADPVRQAREALIRHTRAEIWAREAGAPAQWLSYVTQLKGGHVLSSPRFPQNSGH